MLLGRIQAPGDVAASSDELGRNQEEGVAV